MLVSMIGSPASGKTTTAAMTFARLKDLGISTEFLCERARQYIAEVRVANNILPTETINLVDRDQFTIMQEQFQLEKTMVKGCGESVVVITDSSALNSLFYMTPEFRTRPEVVELANQVSKHYDLTFYCPPIKNTNLISLDPNRIHTEEQSLEVDRNIPRILEEFAPAVKLTNLHGDSQTRYKTVVQCILSKM